MGPFCNKKRVQDSFYKETLSFPNSCFSQADRNPALEEEVKELLLKGAVEKINTEDPGFYSQIFLVPKKTGNYDL